MAINQEAGAWLIGSQLQFNDIHGHQNNLNNYIPNGGQLYLQLQQYQQHQQHQRQDNQNYHDDDGFMHLHEHNNIDNNNNLISNSNDDNIYNYKWLKSHTDQGRESTWSMLIKQLFYNGTQTLLLGNNFNPSNQTNLTSLLSNTTTTTTTNFNVPVWGLNWTKLLLTTLLILIMLATAIGNLFVIVAILVERNLRTVGNYLVLSLAIADLLVACLVMPLASIYKILDKWTLGVTLCDVWTCADVFCCTASILHLLAIALDRYWAVTRVNYIRCQRNQSRIVIIILIVWTVALITSLAPVFGWKDADFEKRIEANECLLSQDVLYQILATCTTFYLPLTLTLVFYWKIYQVARKRIRKKPGNRIKISLQHPSTSSSNSSPHVVQTSSSASTSLVTSKSPSPPASSKQVAQPNYSPDIQNQVQSHSSGPQQAIALYSSKKSQYKSALGNSMNRYPCGKNCSSDRCHSCACNNRQVCMLDKETGKCQFKNAIYKDNQNIEEEVDEHTKMISHDVVSQDLTHQNNDNQAQSEINNNYYRNKRKNHSNRVNDGDDDDDDDDDDSKAHEDMKYESEALSDTREVFADLHGSNERKNVCPTQTNCNINDDNISKSSKNFTQNQHNLSRSVSADNHCHTCQCKLTSSHKHIATNSGHDHLNGMNMDLIINEDIEAKNDDFDINEKKMDLDQNNDELNDTSNQTSALVEKRELLSNKSDTCLIIATSTTNIALSTGVRPNLLAQPNNEPAFCNTVVDNVESRRERKAAKTLAIITGVFVICWLPFFVIALLMPLLSLQPPEDLFALLQWLGYVNSMLNPIIYTIFSPDFRKAFKRLIGIDDRSQMTRKRKKIQKQRSHQQITINSQSSNGPTQVIGSKAGSNSTVTNWFHRSWRSNLTKIRTFARSSNQDHLSNMNPI